MSEQVNHPQHYGGKDNPYEAIKVIEAWELGFNLGNTVKYISRAGKKGTDKELQDLNKALWYLDREVGKLSGENKPNRKLIIHNPTNHMTRYYRNYNLFWDELTDELSKRYEIIENREYETAHYERQQVFLKNGISSEFLLLECEYVIEDAETGEFWIMSVSDDLGYATLNERNNPLCKKVLISQFISSKIKHHTKDTFHKYSPWIYFPSDLVNLEQFYLRRKYTTDRNSLMYFRGNTSQRPALNHYSEEFLYCPKDTVSSEHYYKELIQYEIALSMAGVGELCYRDIECMAIGVPLIRFEFQTEMFEKLIPNYHYISVQYPDDMPKNNDVSSDRLALEHHAKLIEKRFLEVIDDKEFLEFISKNARQYYLDNLSPQNRVNKTLEILGL